MPMQQSNALRRLWAVLNQAVCQGNDDAAGGDVLLHSMKLGTKAQNLIDFYELLNRAKKEARRLEDPSIDEYITLLEELGDLFITNHVWSVKWSFFSGYIRSNKIILILNLLAKDLHEQNPKFLVEQDYLEELIKEFESLLGEIISSDLSKELKDVLKQRVEDILSAIRNYHIHGTEGLEQSAQSFISDLVIAESTLQDQDRKNSTYSRVVSSVLGLLLWMRPSPWDIIGGVPDIHDFWIPKIEELTSRREQIEQIVREAPTIQEACERSLKVLNKQPQRSLTGHKEPKALPASKEEPKIDIGDAD